MSLKCPERNGTLTEDIDPTNFPNITMIMCITHLLTRAFVLGFGLKLLMQLHLFTMENLLCATI